MAYDIAQGVEIAAGGKLDRLLELSEDGGGCAEETAFM